MKIFGRRADIRVRTKLPAMSRMSVDRPTPISFEVGVSIEQSSHEERKKEGKRKLRPVPDQEEVDNTEENPKHQVDDMM